MSPDELESPRLAEAQSPLYDRFLDVEVPEDDDPESPGAQGYLSELPGGESDLYENPADLEEALRWTLFEDYPDATPEELDDLLSNLLSSPAASRFLSGDALAPAEMPADTRLENEFNNDPLSAAGAGAVPTEVDEATASMLLGRGSTTTAASGSALASGVAGGFAPPASPAVQPIVASMAGKDEDATAGSRTVVGTVMAGVGSRVGGLRIEIIDRNVGEDVRLAEVVTDERGVYEAILAPGDVDQGNKQRPDLQARVYAGESLVGVSEVRYNADRNESLDISLPAGAVSPPSEYETLTGAIAAHYGGTLAALQESEERSDIAYLANKSGWDARAVALAALAEQFSQDSAQEQGIPPALYYALFRAGLPANPGTLYRADPQTVTAVWRSAIQQGIIPGALEDQLDRSAEVFRELGVGRLLDTGAFPGAGTVQQLTHGALGDDPERQRVFADLLSRHRDDPQALWTAARQSLGESATRRLQLDGQLAYLTLDNAPLIDRLHQAEGGLSSPLELAEKGYYRPARWYELLDGAVPDAVPGDTPDERRIGYAQMLAEQVRLSFPTAVVATMVGSGELPLTGTDETHRSVQAFLTEHQDRFEIGMQPIDQYVAQNDLGDQLPEPAREQIKRVQRVYQITPTDETMAVLLRNNLDSAYRIVEHGEDEFVQAFADQLGGEQLAQLTYAQAQQVHNTVLNVASTYLTGRAAPALGANPAAPILGESANTSAATGSTGASVLAYPTLEGLFGSMDFCTCEHCRSVLSPAAYLVDLLLFLDRPVNVKDNPQSVLFERRPDLQHLPLTCENTNAPLPYIDIVNEALEHFIANNLSLAGYTGHDPGLAATATYAALQEASFPPPLPFHRALETLRSYYARLGIPLPAAMEILRVSDALQRSNEPGAYGWHDILMERLGLSREEHRLLTDRTVTLQQLYGYPPATPLTDVLADLRSVKAFTRRTGLTVAELTALLRTSFINPHSALLPRLEQLQLPFATLKALKDGTLTEAEFGTLLPPGLDPSQYDGDVAAWVKNSDNYTRIMGLLTIGAPPTDGSPCSAEQLRLRYSNPDDTTNSLTDLDYLRLARFIRLWRKLGWSVQETDAAIGALFSGNADSPERLDEGFLALLARLGTVVEVMDRLRLRHERDLARLLACWTPIATAGPDSLYRQMFLASSLSAPDPAFADDGYGNVLHEDKAKLLDHAETLRATFNLTGEELAAIVAALHYDANTPLTLATISAVHRRGWLARALRLSVREMLLLVRWTGLDPFAMPDPPHPAILRLLDLLDGLRAASLKPVQVLYLMWNQDLSGRSAPDEAEVTELSRALRADAEVIDRDFVVVDDPAGEIARARLGLVYGTEATDFLFGLLDDKLAVSVPYAHPQPQLEPQIGAASDQLSYDDLRKQLSYNGVLSASARDALKGVAGAPPMFKQAIDSLYAASQTAIGPFFSRYPELLPLYSVYAASTDPPESRRAALLAGVLPELKRRRKTQQAVALAAAATRTSGPLAQTLLTDVAVLHATGDPTRPGVEDLTVTAGTPGLSAQFFWADTATGPPDHTVDAAPVLAYAKAGPALLPANPTPAPDDSRLPISGIWCGRIEAPETGFYNIAIEADATATVRLLLEGKPVTLANQGGVWTNQSPISLTGGVLHPVSLLVEKVTATLVVRWKTTGRGWEVIPQRLLYPEALLERLRGTYIRFLKAASLATALRLSPTEISHFATHPDHRIGGAGWLNALTSTGNPTETTAQALFDVLIALLDFVRIRDASALGDDELVALLGDPTASLPNGTKALPARMGWEPGSLDALLTRFGKTVEDLAHISTLARIHDAYELIKTPGIPATALIPATSNDPGTGAVGGLEAALRARHDPEGTLELARQVNDELRSRRRDALVAHILQRLAASPSTRQIDTAEKLFEFFLMDVQMDPCMQTSRIRHALSSIQLFIERCLMNLEPRVAPSSINADRWEWMKRYRVWEANRKVFLWPENWLEPELRDDQSPFFTEAMSELLQGDITDEAAATALIGYLSKLEEVAQLEPCGIHYVENDPGVSDDVAHVMARTAGARRSYYYRRRAHGSWTPWEPIKLDIEDNPVLPVVWRGRLFLFWLRILKQTPIDPADLPSSDDKNTTLAGLSLEALSKKARSDAQTTKLTVQAILCWSEYYNGQWQPPKTSDANRPTELAPKFDPAGAGAFNRAGLVLAALPELGGLRLLIRGSGSSSFLFLNSHSAPLIEQDRVAGGVEVRLAASRAVSRDQNRLKLTYYGSWTWTTGGPPPPFDRSILQDWLPFTIAQPMQLLDDAWHAPFLFADSRRVYYVTTTWKTATVSKFNGFGAVLLPTTPQVIELSPMILDQDLLAAGSSRDGAQIMFSPGIGDVDPDPEAQLRAVPTNIHTRLASTASVRYRDRELGPAGVVLPQALTREA